MGGRSRTSAQQTSQQTTNTTSTGLQDTEGFAAAAGGDLEITQNISDQGAIENAFGFAQGFSESAFEFANDVSKQAGEVSERAIETSQLAAATVATGGQSDLSRIDSKTIGLAVAGIVAIMILPQLIKGAK